MKKYIFMAVAGMLALSSCSNDDNDVQNAPRQMTFIAGFGDEAQTRATLNGKKVSFDKNDAISILSANNTNTKITTTEDGASVTFTGTATADANFYAVYPYTGGLTLDTSTGTISGVTIPVDQTNAATSGWDPAAPIAYATTTGTSLQFKNACALLKITNDRDKANIYVQCYEDALSGTFSLDTSNGALSGSDPDINYYVMVGNVPSGKTIYIAILPGEKHDFSAICWGSDYAWKDKMSVTFEAGKIYDLGKTSEWDE